MIIAGDSVAVRVMGGYTGIHEPAIAARPAMSDDLGGQAVLNDEEVVDRLRKRDVATLEAVYERHSRAVFSLALRMLGEHEAAEEVVQETFLKLWQRPDTYVPGRGRLLTWLLGVAHHRAVDRLRRRRLELRLATDHRLLEWGTSEDPEDRALAQLSGQAVLRAVRELPSAQRVVVELAYVRGMTQVEIAKSLGEPLGTVKTRLRLAMQKLRGSLEIAAMRPGAT